MGVLTNFWCEVFSWWGLCLVVSPSSILDLFDHWEISVYRKTIKGLWFSLSSILWTLWLEKNRVVFDNVLYLHQICSGSPVHASLNGYKHGTPLFLFSVFLLTTCYKWGSTAFSEGAVLV